MDKSHSDTSSQEGVPKKSPFDDLSREELINKCKGLLVIAQKAKQAKTELQSEVENFKLQLEKSETEKNDVQQNFQTLQELVNSLTEQKLNIITEVDSAKNKIKSLTATCKTYEDDINKYKAELIVKDQNIMELKQRLSEIDCEVISLKRQNYRLSEENEQLINQLTEIEARTAEFNNICLHQREQLKMLEQNALQGEKYKSENELLNIKITEFENQLKLAKQKVISEEVETKLNDLQQLYDSEVLKNEKANAKLRSYKDKILRCAACINQLKNSRYILNKTVKEYSENIPKWQNDIINASKVLDTKISDLNRENIELKEKIALLEQQVKTLKTAKTPKNTEIQDMAALKEEKIHLESKINQLQYDFEESENIKIHLQQQFNELKLKYTEVIENEIPSHINESLLLKEKINENIDNIMALNNKNKELTDKMNQLSKENEKLNHLIKNQSSEIVENLNLQIRALESEKDILVKEKLNARDAVIDLENNNKMLTEDINKLKVEIRELKTHLDKITQENAVLINTQKTEKEDEINTLVCKLKTQEELFNSMKKEYDDLQDLNNLLKEEVETLKLSLEQPKDESENLSDINVSLQADIVKLETKLASYKQENETLINEMKDSRIKVKECEAILTEYHEVKSKLASYKSENTELLNEMKEINQVLKERGESISKQQKAIIEMERLIETLEKDRDSTNAEKKELVQKIESLENQIKDVEKKTSESSGFIEEVMAERDNAKKQLEENNQLIATLKEEIEKLKAAPPVELPNEDMSASTISRAEDYSRMKDLDETFEDKYSKLRIFALKLKKKLNETTALLQNTEQDKAKLEKMLTDSVPVETKIVSSTQTWNTEPEKQTNAQETNDLQEKLKSLTEEYENVKLELDNVKAQLNLKSQELATEIEAHKATKDNLEKARRDVKKKNVLSLEMEDYERSMKELTAKMEEKKKKMVQMESTIDTQEGIINTMKTQIKLLEEQIKTEETQNRLTKEELHHALEETKNKDNVILAKNSIITKLEQDLEDEKRKNEETDLEMTSLISEKEKVIMSLGEEKTELNNKVKRLEFRCAELNEKLKITNMELADLKTEYTSYKVRAQAVLRQNQTVDHSQEEQLKEEAAALRAQIETITSKLNLAQEQCAEQTAEAENARRRASEASNEAAHAQQRTARLHSDLTRLAQQLDTERNQHKLQVSTLTQCYKSQISELELKLQKETDLLKKQLALAQESALSGSQASFVEDTHQNQYMLPVIPKDDSDGEMDINVSMIPREEGEGSESAPSPPPSKSYLSGGGGARSPVPLERLLEEGVPEDEALDTSSLGLTPDQEIADLKRRLQAQQQRVKHVTVLLSESERECARMAQLSELLKSELRRVRGTANNPHNTEYMKNVTLKFLTLPPGDERSRLVPVLQKILTLTSDETQKIQAVAKGLDPNPSKGWGSYLPWPGASK